LHLARLPQARGAGLGDSLCRGGLIGRARSGCGVVTAVKLIFVLQWELAPRQIYVRRKTTILGHAVDGAFINSIASRHLPLAQVTPVSRRESGEHPDRGRAQWGDQIDVRASGERRKKDGGCRDYYPKKASDHGVLLLVQQATGYDRQAIGYETNAKFFCRRSLVK
jgi:hypothetical protein